MEYNIYRLKDGLTPVSWQLPLKEVFVKKFVTENGERKDLGFRRIKFVPGTDTIFAEDIKGDLQPEQIWFEYGDLRVLKDDKLKNELLQQHPWYNKRYTLWSQESEDKEKLADLRFKGEARKLIEEADQDKIKAIALAVFGYKAILWNEDRCELELRQEADSNPKNLKEIMDEKDYEAKLFAAHAFVQGIVEENKNKTAVIWTESAGVILKLAKGEKGISELGRYLATRTDESEMVLQSIGERLDKIATNVATVNKTAQLKAKDKEIEALKAQISTGESTEDVALEEARNAYEDKIGTIPPNMKNNLSWLTKKVAEKDAE